MKLIEQLTRRGVRIAGYCDGGSASEHDCHLGIENADSMIAGDAASRRYIDRYPEARDFRHDYVMSYRKGYREHTCTRGQHHSASSGH